MTRTRSPKRATAPSAGEVLDVIDRMFPPSLAEEWDNVGLNLGDPATPVRTIWLALDPSWAAVKEAGRGRHGLLICHHPLIFPSSSLSRIDLSTPLGRVIGLAVSRGVPIIAAHTNVDWGQGGLCDLLAARLGLVEVHPWQPLFPHAYRKLVVFVPRTHLLPVSEAIFQAGGGIIGNYAKCSYRLEGHGTYVPLAGADPYAGKVGEMSVEPEARLEVRIPVERVDRVLAAMKAAHPYEEAAFDLYPTERQSPAGGRGRIGRLARPATLAKFARRAARALGAGTGRFVGDPAMPVQEVFVCSGSGSSFIRHFFHRPGTVLVVGEVKYHEALQAQDHGLAVIDLGHYATERLFVDGMAERLSTALAKEGRPVPVRACRPAGDPFRSC